MKTYRFYMDLAVHDEAALIAAANKHPDSQGLEFKGADRVEAALIILLDPSTLPGCEIYSSDAERHVELP